MTARSVALALLLGGGVLRLFLEGRFFQDCPSCRFFLDCAPSVASLGVVVFVLGLLLARPLVDSGPVWRPLLYASAWIIAQLLRRVIQLLLLAGILADMTLRLSVPAASSAWSLQLIWWMLALSLLPSRHETLVRTSGQWLSGSFELGLPLAVRSALYVPLRPRCAVRGLLMAWPRRTVQVQRPLSERAWWILIAALAWIWSSLGGRVFVAVGGAPAGASAVESALYAGSPLPLCGLRFERRC